MKLLSKISNFTKRQKILAVVITLAVLLGGHIIKCILLDNKVIASEPVEADFYLIDEDKFWSAYPKIDSECFEWVGTGNITYSHFIYNNSKKLTDMIVSSPSDVTANWAYAGKFNGKYYVGAIAGEEIEKVEQFADNDDDNKKAKKAKKAKKTEEPKETEETEEIEETEDLGEPMVDGYVNADGDDSVDEEIDTTSEEEIEEEEETEEPEEEVVEEEVEEEPAGPQTYTLSRSAILSTDSSSYADGESVKWDKFYKSRKDVADGVIPVALLDDPIYTSMNLPSESRSEAMEDAVIDNGHVLASNDDIKAGTHMMATGSIYKAKNGTLPQKLKISIGKIKIFGYSKKTKKWEIIREDPHITGVKVYSLPWENASTYAVPMKTFADHIEVTCSATDLKNKALHFWGKQTEIDNSKYDYYATAYVCWTDSQVKSGSLTATNAVDLKESPKADAYAQLVTSRGLSVTGKRRVVWSTTIPNKEYQPEWGAELQKLFDK